MTITQLCNVLLLVTAIATTGILPATAKDPVLLGDGRLNPSYPADVAQRADDAEVILPENRQHCLYLAATYGYYRLARYLLVPEIVVNAEGSHCFTDTVSADSLGENGDPVLHEAARRGRSKTVILLLSREANPNLPNWLGNTALHEAVLSSYFDIACLLLSKDANPLAQNRLGITPLDRAISLKNKSDEHRRFAIMMSNWASEKNPMKRTTLY